MSITLDYLRATMEIERIEKYGAFFQRRRPKITCVDGFNMSVQGSEGHYCSPRENGWEFTTVEIGYPSERVEELMLYAKSPERPLDTVYGWVPVEIVDALIIKHGGIKI